MQAKLVSVGRILLFLAVGIFFLVLAFRDVQFEDLISGLLSARYEWVLVSLVFASLAFVSRTYRWILLIEPLGYSPSRKSTFYALMTGYLANFIFPRMGEITRCGSLNKTDGIPADSLLGTVIIERLSDLLALVVLLLIVLFVKFDLFGAFLFNNLIQPVYQKIFSWLDFPWFLWFLAISFILLAVLFYRIILVWLNKYKIFRKLERVAGRVMDGMKTILDLKKKMQFLFHTIFIWLMYFLMTRALFASLPATADLGAATVLFILVIGGLGMAAPVQGGIGTYHWIVSMGLGLYEIPREEGLVFATLSHESQALLMIILGSFSALMVFGARKKARQPDEPSNSQQLNSQQNGQT
jgi:glycosyltransferase 2 family protein